MQFVWNLETDFLPLTISGLEAKANIYSAIEENLILYCLVFLAFVTVIDTVHFAKESLLFQNWLLNGAYSILDMKRPWYNLSTLKWIIYYQH